MTFPDTRDVRRDSERDRRKYLHMVKERIPMDEVRKVEARLAVFGYFRPTKPRDSTRSKRYGTKRCVS
jgi:hypothetical protein